MENENIGATRSALNLDSFDKALESRGIQFKKQERLAARSTFRIGGPADTAVFPSTEEELIFAIDSAVDSGTRFLVCGNGSDLVFDDAGFRGAVIFTSGLKGLSVRGGSITAGCGLPLIMLSKAAADSSLTGLEFAYGIPGSVGGAVFMNAGAYGGQISDVLVSCRMYDRETRRIKSVGNREMRFGYRTSLAATDRRYTVLSAEFALGPGDPGTIRATMSDLMGRRISKQPLDLPSAGSVFKRPAPDIFAGRLIEDAGLKGCRIGGAEVSVKHAGFIVNAGGATCADVKALCDSVRDRVEAASGIRLECEIIFVPETGRNCGSI